MKAIINILEPRSLGDVIIRLVVFIALFALANLVFLEFFDPPQSRQLPEALVHAAFVGGPFVLVFFALALYQRALIHHFRDLARKDGLTGVNNRDSFLAAAADRLESSVGGVVLLLDADHFKQVNDQHGHQTGDNCLQVIAETLHYNLRGADVIGRIGGEEFAVFLDYTMTRQAKIIAERLTKPIPFESAVTGETLTITMSIGAVEVEPGLTVDALLARADEALYHAKASGRACMSVWSEIQAEKQSLPAAG
ncbi:GGDEF domain-containing protein [Yoonia sp. BS5-3]|uniref:diguanylate cyclase n=1 Tax=Yoonia phaeophyticola TaxID=3137369 RepID=A0ABZ2V5E1_9RHOB